MTRPPMNLSLQDEQKDEELVKTLDLADWEKDIVMCSLCASHYLEILGRAEGLRVM